MINYKCGVPVEVLKLDNGTPVDGYCELVMPDMKWRGKILYRHLITIQEPSFILPPSRMDMYRDVMHLTRDITDISGTILTDDFHIEMFSGVVMSAKMIRDGIQFDEFICLELK